MIPDLITFSDTAKYADAARSLIEGSGYVIHHSFFDPIAIQAGRLYFDANFPPLPSLIMAAAFLMFGANDLVVIGLGLLFYSVLLVSVFLLAKKIFSTYTAIIAVALLLCDRYFFFYARNFTPEILLSIWIILTCFALMRPRYQKLLVVVPIFLSYLTKQQYSVLFVAIVVYLYMEITRRLKPQDKIKVASGVLLLMVGFVGFGNLNVASNLSPIKAMYSANMLPGVIPGDYLRGENTKPIGVKGAVSKLFYNSYNFAKEPTRVVSWVVIFGLILSMTIKEDKKNRIYTLTRFGFLLSILMILASALSLPNARYIHPVTPLLCVIAAGGLVQMAGQLKKGRVVLLLLLLLGSIPTIGGLTLDYRYLSASSNLDKPTAVKVISQVIDDHTDAGLVLTNLDAWAAWYNKVSTMWFPLSMSQIKQYDDQIKYIAITDYNSTDSDFRLNDWGQLLGPDGVEGTTLADKYVMIHRGTIESVDVRENYDIQIIILKHK